MYRLNDEQQKIIARVREIADGPIAQHASDVDSAARFPEEGIKALGKGGFLGLTIPTEYGGMGQGLRVAVAALDEIGQRCASTGMVYLMHLCGVSCYVANPNVAEKQLREAAAGKHLSTLAWSERGSRSHFWAPVSQAVASNGHVTVSAEKSWVTSAGHAQGYVVSTKSPNSQGPTDSVLYLVLGSDAGTAVSGPWDSMGLRGNASAPMTLKAVELSSDRAFCEPGKGFEMMLSVVLPWFQLGNAAISVGLAEGAVGQTANHLTGKGFAYLGSKLSDLPNLRARLAQMRIETDRARAHLAATVDAVENPGSTTMLLVLESKAAASESAMEVTDLAMRACGGAAFSKHLAVERQFRDARAANVMAPTSDVLYDFIGKALCGMELF